MVRDLTPGLLKAAFENGPVARPEDCEQIVRIAWRKLYLWMNQWQAQEVWLHYSGTRDAQWITTINEDTVTQAIQEFVRYRLNIEYVSAE